MSFIDFLRNINPFKKNEEPDNFPPDFALIKPSNVARSEGILDDENKIVVRYNDGIPVNTTPYSKAYVDALREIDGIPVEEEQINEEEDFEFDSNIDFGILQYKK